MNATPAEQQEQAVPSNQLPEFVDWLLAAAIALGGLVAIVGGTLLAFVVDRELLAAGIEGGEITVTLVTTELTDAEMLVFVGAVVDWTGWGLLLTGLGMVVFAVGFVVRRHRTHARADATESTNTYGANAVLGAVVTAVLSFLPFSPGVGGAVAGYLERATSERTVSVGALSGLLAMVPLIAILLFVLGGMIAGLLGIGRSGLAIVVGAVMVLVLLLVATIGAGLGALGGYVGGRFAESRD